MYKQIRRLAACEATFYDPDEGNGGEPGWPALRYGRHVGAIGAVSTAATALALPERWHHTMNASYETFRVGPVRMGLQQSLAACRPARTACQES